MERVQPISDQIASLMIRKGYRLIFPFKIKIINIKYFTSLRNLVFDKYLIYFTDS